MSLDEEEDDFSTSVSKTITESNWIVDDDEENDESD